MTSVTNARAEIESFILSFTPDDRFAPNDRVTPDDGVAPDDAGAADAGISPDRRAPDDRVAVYCVAPDNGPAPHNRTSPDDAVTRHRVGESGLAASGIKRRHRRRRAPVGYVSIAQHGVHIEIAGAHSEDVILREVLVPQTVVGNAEIGRAHV